MRRIVLMAGLLALGGCASSTGVLPAGPDTYTVTEASAPVRGGSIEAQRVASNEANAYCEQRGRVFVPTTMNTAGNLYNQYGPTGYSITFRCLRPDDPAVASYRLERAPDTIIEQRNR
jgi:hypothetical protein